MLGGHFPSASGDIKYLICQVTSQKHAIEGSSNFMSGVSLWYVTTLTSLVVIGIVVVEICHIFSLSRDQARPRD